MKGVKEGPREVYAREALRRLGCPESGIAERIQAVVEHLCIDPDGVARVAGPDGNPRTQPSLVSGEPEPYPLTRWLRDYALLRGIVPRWSTKPVRSVYGDI